MVPRLPESDGKLPLNGRMMEYAADFRIDCIENLKFLQSFGLNDGWSHGLLAHPCCSLSCNKSNTGAMASIV